MEHSNCIVDMVKGMEINKTLDLVNLLAKTLNMGIHVSGEGAVESHTSPNNRLYVLDL